MTTTCAIVLIDKDGNILACHGTGRQSYTGYDFPKGCVDWHETDIQAACRELKEETGLTIEQLKSDGLTVSDYLIDGGVFKHNSHKNIHIFLCPLKSFPDINNLKCTSFFWAKFGKRLPEMDGYKIISKEERKLFNEILWNKFEIIDDLNSMVDYGN